MDDPISRQAAIEVLEWFDQTDPLGHTPVQIVRALPAAEPKIIRCKDCTHRDPEDKKCDCGHAILWQLPRDDNWYCADAERRSDE